MYQMKIISIAAMAISLAANACAAGNPDEGKKMRLVCYGLKKNNDLSTRDYDFSIIVEQASTYFTDASYYVPGNYHYSDPMFIVTQREGFNVYIFRNADQLSKATDRKVYSDELLEHDPDEKFDNVEGYRADGLFTVSWSGDDYTLNFERTNQKGSVYYDASQEFGEKNSAIFCEDPFGVEVK